jgi:hypothetical protein
MYITSRHFKKMHIIKAFFELKRRKQVEILAVLAEKNKIAFNFLYTIKKLTFLVVILFYLFIYLFIDKI